MATSHCHADQLEISRHTNCPSDHWHNRAAPLLASDTTSELTMLNVGANKGYNLVEWMQRYTDAPHSNADWHKLMMRQADPPCALQCCGVCIVCRRQRATQAARARLRLHAFELQPSNERLLRQLVSLSGAPAEVHGAAVSNVSTGVVWTHDNAKPGYESVSAQKELRGRGKTAIARNVTTVDAFLAARSIGRAHFVSIDTEGWDAFVMLGMRRALERKAVDMFEFEYTRAWKPHLGEHALAAHLAWLDGLGYTCFWQGNSGALAQANGGCWRPDHHDRISHRWSNLVCTARADLVALFRSLREPAAKG